jgi:hypothetical protein
MVAVAIGVDPGSREARGLLSSQKFKRLGIVPSLLFQGSFV